MSPLAVTLDQPAYMNATTATFYAADAEAVHHARRYAQTILDGWLWPGAGDSAVRIVSEFVTNALRYTPGPALLHLSYVGGLIRVEVTDPVAAPVAAIEPDMDDDTPHGWGLHIVSGLSERWGCAVLPWGRVLCAEVRP